MRREIKIKPQAYTDPRPAETMAPFHEWARTHEPGWTYAAVRVLLTPVALLVYRTRGEGARNVPRRGAVILAPNHFSNMDHFFCGVFLRRQIRFMSKSQFFGGQPAISYLFRVSGHFPVRRGHADEEAFINRSLGARARGVRWGLRRGWAVAHRRARRAATGRGATGARDRRAVVPVAIHGSDAVRGWRRGRFPRVRVSYGELLRFDVVPAPSRDKQLEAAQAIFARVRAQYAELAGSPQAG
ncbi:MAG TPA: lysophospholipid acyltransferase family protein [Solirubrobacteraceae bacterium]|nr:lysophospholipid acyltransferase family protein [Solirubrobacteraceae bacterium]